MTDPSDGLTESEQAEFDAYDRERQEWWEDELVAQTLGGYEAVGVNPADPDRYKYAMEMHLLDKISGPTKKRPCRKVFFRGEYVGVKGGYETFQAKVRDFMAIGEAKRALEAEGLPADNKDIARWLVDNGKLDVRENRMGTDSSRSDEAHVQAAYQRVLKAPKMTVEMFVDMEKFCADKALECDATVYELSEELADAMGGPYYIYYYPRG